MARYTSSPDDLDAAAGQVRRDAELLRGLAPTLDAATSEGRTGVGVSHPRLAQAMDELGRVERAVLLALADAAEILTAGFAGAAEDYRDAEIRAAAMVRPASGS